MHAREEPISKLPVDDSEEGMLIEVNYVKGGAKVFFNCTYYKLLQPLNMNTMQQSKQQGIFF